MSNKTDKPKMNPRQLVVKMRDEKGITFNHISETEAEIFLTERNIYIKTASYRKAYEKYTRGNHTGKYQNLDFAYLKELSTLDMHFRFLVEKMCSDIEHSLCVNINQLIDNDPTTDGYDIVYQFLCSRHNVVSAIERSVSSPHTGNLIKKYFTVATHVDPQTQRVSYSITAFNDCPVWVLLEVMTFGDIIHFYNYYCSSRNITSEPIEVLHLVRSLRNAAAHNNCLFADLKSGSTAPPRVLTSAVANLTSISKSQRQKKMACRSVLEFVALLYEYDRLVKDDVRLYRIQELKGFFTKRMVERKDFFSNNNLLRTTYSFAISVIEGFLVQ